MQTRIDPDVTLIIGGQEFKEYSHSLCSWSGYFDRALSSGMKEEITYQFEFPDRSPKEWEWIVSLMAPMATAKVTKQTLGTAIDWFDFLCSDIGLAECDNVMFRCLLPLFGVQPFQPFVAEPQKPGVDASLLALIMENMETCVAYNMKFSKERCIGVVQQTLLTNPTLLSKDMLQLITRLIKEDAKCRNLIWNALDTHIPESITVEQKEIMLQNDILHEVVNLVIRRKQDSVAIFDLRQRKSALEDRMVDIVERNVPARTKEYNSRFQVVMGPSAPIQKAFQSDPIWGEVVPSSWA